MALPSYTPLSGTQFRVGFGPRGTNQRLILTKVHVDRLAECEGKIVVDAKASRSSVDVVSADKNSRYKKIFRIPWELHTEENVARAVRESLRRANGNLCNRVAFTPLGYSDEGILSPDQSARAMLGAIYALWAGEENKVPHQILISIHADSMAYQDFEIALERHFFPHRQAENPNSGLDWKRAFGRWGARNLRGKGQILFERLEDLAGDNGREAALAIHEIAQERPGIFKAKDVDRLSAHDSYDGIPETLLVLRQLGGKLGEAARMALINREKSEAMEVMRKEIERIDKADREELTEAVAEGRETFLDKMALGLNRVDVASLYSGTGPLDVRCSYNNLWGKLAMISWKNDSGQIRPQFIRFHRAEKVTKSPMRNELYSMGMRVANKEEALWTLSQIRGAAAKRYGNQVASVSERLDGSQPWFLNLSVEYREERPGQKFDWDSSDLPEDLGRGVLYLHFQNHAETDWDSQRVLQILSDHFGLTFISPKDG